MTGPLSETNPAGTEEVAGSQPGIPAHQQQQGALDKPMGAEATGANHDPDPATSASSGSTPEQEIERLRVFLVEELGQEPVTTPDGPESPVDVAIRLITAKPPLVNYCSESFCNKPEGHRGGHGWVNR